MYDFPCTDLFEEEQIETVRQRLTRLDREALFRFYQSSLHSELLAREEPPRAPYLRQLLKAWQERAEQAQAAGESVLLPAIPFLMTRNPAGTLGMLHPVDTPGQHAESSRLLFLNTGGFYV